MSGCAKVLRHADTSGDRVVPAEWCPDETEPGSEFCAGHQDAYEDTRWGSDGDDTAYDDVWDYYADEEDWLYSDLEALEEYESGVGRL